jgi:hypothetical protein
MMSRLKEIEEDNRRLKKKYVEERPKAEIIQEATAKKVVNTPQRLGKPLVSAITGAVQ